MKEIPLTRGYVAMVDDADYERVVAAGSWYAKTDGSNTYAARNVRKPNGTRTTQRLHHFVLETESEVELPDREAALLWIDENQLGRRNLNDDQRGAIAGRVANLKAEISRRERAAEAGKVGGNGRKGHKKSSLAHTVCAELTEAERTSRIDEEVAKKSNVPRRDQHITSSLGPTLWLKYKDPRTW